MNWAGIAFGAAMAAAVAGGAGAAFLPRLVPAALALAGAGLGVAGMCLVLGADYVAIVVALLLGALVPSALLIVAVLAPPPEPDLRSSLRRRGAVAVLTTGIFFALVLTLTRRPWPPAGGPRQLTVEWLGSRLLTDDLPILLAAAGLLAVAASGAVALLRPRARQR